jgi:hypothetical protein
MAQSLYYKRQSGTFDDCGDKALAVLAEIA